MRAPSRFAPFSLFAFYGIWRVFFRPSEKSAERRFERFLTCSILVGLLIFSLAAHFRSDLILPLWPAAALLAGRELAALARRIGWRRFGGVAAAAAAALFVVTHVTYHPKKGPRARMIQLTTDVHDAAVAFKATGLDPASIEHLDTKVTFQMHLGTSRQWLQGDELEAFRNRPGRRWLATEEADAAEILRVPAKNVTEVFRWPPVSERSKSIIRVFEPE